MDTLEDRVAALRREADEMLSRLKGLPDEGTLRDGQGLVKRLQQAREFTLLTKVAEAVIRQLPNDASTRRRYAQALIELGYASIAVDVLRRLLKDPQESSEAYGLTGRANKQIYFDAGDKTSPAAREALKQAIAAYRRPFEASPGKNYWHGVNLLALLTAARGIGLKVPSSPDPPALVNQLLEILAKTPEQDRDYWYHATLAETHLALRNWTEVENHLRLYVTDARIDAFALGSTLRQFTEVWNLEADEGRGRPLVAILRARLMQLPCADVALSPGDVRRLASVPPPTAQLEAVLGHHGFQTYQWMQNAVTRAKSVGAVRKKADGSRYGTCFLIRARSLGFDSDEPVALTNYHVVNREGESPGIRPSAAEVRFEAADQTPTLAVTEVIWSSHYDQLDATVLRLAAPGAAVAPLEASPYLPVLDEPQQVFVIGHPLGNELSFSFQDNELIDHEGPPKGTPPLAGRVRLHYRTPTEGGSSGSPVFNEELEVIGLHHLGGRDGVKKLNGKPGEYGANEAIWIRSIVEAQKSSP